MWRLHDGARDMSTLTFGAANAPAEMRRAAVSVMRSMPGGDATAAKFVYPHALQMHAFESVHADGVRGRGINVLVLEGSGVDPAVCAKHTLGACACTCALASGAECVHGARVAEILHDCAPECNLTGEPVMAPLEFANALPSKNFDVVNASFVINLSHVRARGGFQFEMMKTLARNNVDAVKDRTLIVIASGNDGTPMDGDESQSWSFFLGCENVIFVNSIDAHFQRSAFSNTQTGAAARAGTIAAVGEGIVFDDGETSDGTSYSAPAVAAAAALVMQATDKKLRPKLVRHALLSSAHRTFFQPASADVGESGVFVSDNDRYIANVYAKNPPSMISTQRFDETRYGQGILNVAGAVRHARLMAEAMQQGATEEAAMFHADGVFKREKGAAATAARNTIIERAYALKLGRQARANTAA